MQWVRSCITTMLYCKSSPQLHILKRFGYKNYHKICTFARSGPDFQNFLLKKPDNMVNNADRRWFW